MPNKRKRNAGDAPMAKRKVGAAPKRAAAQEGTPGTASTPAAETSGSSPSAEAGATQPIGSIDDLGEGSSPSSAAARSEAHTVPLGDGETPATPTEDPAAKVFDTATSAEADAAFMEEEADGSEGVPSERPHVKVIKVAKDEAHPTASSDSIGPGKTTKRKSTRSERRRDRKKAKADKRAQASTAQRTFRIVRTLVIVLAVLAIIAGGAAAAGISYHRWQAYDDALDIQGTWYVSGTDTPIEVTEDTIVLADDVAYKYKLDPSSKTITFSFGNLKGEGHYRFSLDRQYLVIFDGKYTWEQSLSTDVAWLLQALQDQFFGNPNDLAQGAFYNVTLLSRSSADDSGVSASVVTTPEGPRVVWSAPDAEGGTSDATANGSTGDNAGNGGSANPSDSGSTSDSDMDSLLGNLSDRPAD